ncbi:MAG: hypothetical protein QNL87_09655 [Gammaproteobacteria bacterium]|nr:hypothetical protein [Gammaproteobacteria bacterium]
MLISFILPVGFVSNLFHHFIRMFRHEWRGTFLCSAKEKYPKEMRPDGLPATRVPCASRDFERSPDSQHLPRLRLANPARQDGSPALKIPAMLGGANGYWKYPPEPVALTELRAAPDWRGTQGISASR